MGNATGVTNEGGNAMMQKFWDSAMALAPIDDEDDTRRLWATLLKQKYFLLNFCWFA